MKTKMFFLLMLLVIVIGGISAKAQTYTMSNTPITTCSGTFYDPGGTGNYASSLDITQTFTPATAGNMLRFTFTAFNTESGYDYLYIYNGPTTASPLIGTYNGTTSPGTITASNPTGQLTFRFTSDGSVTYAGWTASISCIVPLPGENCSNAQNLATLSSPYSGTTVGYADDIATCRTGYPDRMFYINIPNGYTVDIWQSTNSYDSYHYMGYGSSCPGTQIYCVDDPDTQNNPWTNSTGSSQTVWFIIDAYSGSGTFTLNWTLTPPPAYHATFISMNTGSATWCAGETRNVTVTVQNTGSATWTDASPDINIGCKWNADPDYLVRVNAGSLAPGATNTYTLTMTAPATLGSNNLTFDVVNEGNCWFGNNNGSCGPGNSVYTSATQTIITVPSIATSPVPANASTGICYTGGTITNSVSWASVTNATSYDVYFGAGSLPGTITANATTTSYSCGTLLGNTTYYWKVVAKNACGNAVGSSTWTFTTASAPCYCASGATRN